MFGEWHDYAVKIEPNQQTYYFDGVQCGEVVTRADGGGQPYAFGPDVTRGNWPILTLAVGGAGGQQDGKAVAPAQLLVDSVTVTALDGSAAPLPRAGSESATPAPTPAPTATVTASATAPPTVSPSSSPSSSPSPSGSPTSGSNGSTPVWSGADGAPWPGWTTWRNDTVQNGRGRLGLTATQSYTSAYWTSQAPVADLDLTTTVDPEITNGAFRVGVGSEAVNDNEPRDGQTVKFGVADGKVTELVVRSSKAGNGSEVAYAPISAHPVTPSATGVRVRVQRTGTTVQAKVWPAGAAEPAAWMITGTDANPAPGRVFLSAQSAAGSVDFSDLTIR